MQNFGVPDLAQVYSRPYTDNDYAWRELGARDKSANIVAMTAAIRSGIRSVLEVGCGTGAVLKNVAHAGLGEKFVGIEITNERVAAAAGLAGDKIHIQSYDGKHIPFDDGSFDLVYATHVLEHVVEPRSFLHEIRRVSRRYVYIEVPCELTLRASQRSLQPSLNIGHINSYTPLSFQLALETAGLTVDDLRLMDAGFGVHAFNSGRATAALKVLLRRLALMFGEKIAAAVFTYHCGALCMKGERLNIG